MGADLDTLRGELSRALTNAQNMNAPAAVVSPLARSLAELRATNDAEAAISGARAAIRSWRNWAFGRTNPPKINRGA
jgi:hypothetical protein